MSAFSTQYIGIVYVDSGTQQSIIKESGNKYKEIIASNAISNLKLLFTIMKDLMPYFEREYGVEKPGDILWSHAVNSKEKLGRCLNNPKTMLIESDIRISKSGKPVVVHPPETDSDLSFDELIQKMQQSKQGLKLDFKDQAVLTPCLLKLGEVDLQQPILLHADILQGNGANPSNFSAVGFLTRCRKYYPSGVLSVGWTTTEDPNLGYTKDNIDEMLRLCEGIKQVTFSARTCWLLNSWEQLTRLIKEDGYTLTIWNNELVRPELQQWIKANIDPKKAFFDLIDENKEQLRF